MFHSSLYARSSVCTSGKMWSKGIFFSFSFSCAPFYFKWKKKRFRVILFLLTTWRAGRKGRCTESSSYTQTFFLILFLLWFIFTTHIAQVNRWHLMHHCSNLLLGSFAFSPSSDFFLFQEKKRKNFSFLFYLKIKNLHCARIYLFPLTWCQCITLLNVLGFSLFCFLNKQLIDLFMCIDFDIQGRRRK
jgi:hypothetical protein